MIKLPITPTTLSPIMKVSDKLNINCAIIMETQYCEITNHFAFSDTFSPLNFVKTLARIRCLIIQAYNLSELLKKNQPDNKIKGIPGIPGSMMPMYARTKKKSPKKINNSFFQLVMEIKVRIFSEYLNISEYYLLTIKPKEIEKTILYRKKI